MSLSALAIADTDPNGDGNDIVVIALAGVLIGGILVLVGSTGAGNTAPPVGVNCPSQACSNGTVCSPATQTCVSQMDGGGGAGCDFCGAGVCCAPWVCNHAILGGTCYDPTTGQGGSGASQCLLPCASSGLVCNPHTHQCESSVASGWKVSWNVATGQTIGFLEDVNPIHLSFDWLGFPLPFEMDADVEFDYTGPGGSATVGFSLKSEDLGGVGLCQYAFTSLANVYLEPASVSTTAIIGTTGIIWPDNCLECDVGMSFTVFPYVILPDGVHYGPAVKSLVTCA